MLRTIQHLLARPLIAVWLATSAHSWQRRVMAEDSPHVHAPGMNPDRVLLAGDGVAAGRGVRTHELGLPGFLARSLSVHTGRAADVDILVDRDMTVMSCRDAVAGIDLFRFEINPHFPRVFAHTVDRHVRDLNLVMQELAENRTPVTVIPLAHVDTFEVEGPHLYQWWAEGISRRISSALDPRQPPADEGEGQDERVRQHTLDHIPD